MHTDSPVAGAPTQISRKSLSWLLVIQIFILAPHFLTVPMWIAVVWVIVAFWRWQIFQGAWNYPTKLHKTVFVVAGCAGLVISLGVNFNFQSMVSLLLVGFILKLLEMKSRKDFVLLIFIALFIIATQFIEWNHFLAALYGFFCLLLLCTTLMQLFQKSTAKSTVSELLPGLYILLQAIPFMIVLFVIIPRLGSFWAVPSPQHAKTGMTDSISPGDLSELIQSNELAFRVTFEGDVPSHNKLYWRGLVLSSFDGRRWSQKQEQSVQRRLRSLHQNSADFGAQVAYIGEKFSYEIIAEPSGQAWLFALAAPQAWSGNVAASRDLRIQAYSTITQRISYRVTSSLDYQLHEINANELTQNLELPAGGNLKTRQLARDWAIEAGGAEQLVQKLLDYYHQSFFYTLRPPALGVDVIDEFLWQSHQGFCEHFASSFVFFMRAAGIPARVVVGYQGGQLNSAEGYLAVRQRDAHAWAEIWIEGRGWVSIDPTAAVAPERIEKGINDSLSENDQKLLIKPFGSSFKILMRIQDQWDALNFQWTRWVMNYDSALQAKLLARLFSGTSSLGLIMVVIGTGIVLLALIFGVLLLRTPRAKHSPMETFYKQLLRKLKPCGIEPQPGESPQFLLNRVVQLRPDLKPALQEIMHLYEQVAYADEVSLWPALKQKLAAFSPSNTPSV